MAIDDFVEVVRNLERLARDTDDTKDRLLDICDRLSDLSRFSHQDKPILDRIEAHLTEIERLGVKEEA